MMIGAYRVAHGSVGEASVGPGRWAITSYLPTYKTSPNYELVALCNSTVESAKRSIEFHGLPSTVKAYGDTSEMAEDPDVDVIVITVNWKNHLQSIKPAILAKKKVFIEWPCGASTAEAEEIARLAKQHGVQTAVGLQMRGDPTVQKAREIIADGTLGRITSAVVTGCFNTAPARVWMKELDFYLDFFGGGNEYHIGFAHCKLNDF